MIQYKQNNIETILLAMKLSWQLNVYCVESNVSDFNKKNTKLSDMFFFAYFISQKLNSH